MSRAKPNDLEKDTPTNSEPKSPGPLVKATAEIWFFFTLDSLIAWLTTGIIFCRCALDASYGTTPPYFSWIFWLPIIFDIFFPSLIMAALVSSHDDSIPSMNMFWFCFML